MVLQLSATIIARTDILSINVAKPFYRYAGLASVTLWFIANGAAVCDDVSTPLRWFGVLFIAHSFRYAPCSMANQL